MEAHVEALIVHPPRVGEARDPLETLAQSWELVELRLNEGQDALEVDGLGSGSSTRIISARILRSCSLGFEITGREGVRLSDKWAKGMRTLHGLQSNGFPNCFFLGYTQSGVSPNYTHTAEERARHFSYLVSTWAQRGPA